MNRMFCVPCFMELQKTREVHRVHQGKNNKETCWHCKKRRFCAQYDIEPKKRKAKEEST